MTKKNEIDGLILKAAQVASLTVDENELKQINKFTLESLAAEDVFVFKVAMCDNEVDRAFENFPIKSLKKMAQLFVGKTMIKDHSRSTNNQVARIYATELQASETVVTKTNEVYTQLIAKVYMLKTDANADLIAEIKAGIKKEVSVALSVKKAICSVCKTDNNEKWCKHYPSREYDGVTCYFSLEEPRDAYELSFVAVPAQPNAGTTKSYAATEETTEIEEPGIQDVDELTVKMQATTSFIQIQKLKGGKKA